MFPIYKVLYVVMSTFQHTLYISIYIYIYNIYNIIYIYVRLKFEGSNNPRREGERE